MTVHVDLALRLDAAARRLGERLPVGRRTRRELEQLLREARAAVRAPPAAAPAPAPADPLAAFTAAAEAARRAGLSGPELIDAFNDTLERCAAPAPTR